MWLFDKYCRIQSWKETDEVKVCNGVKRFAAPTKFVPQSVWISVTGPRRVINLVNASKKVSVERSEQSSRCKALVAIQTKRQMYTGVRTFERPRVPFTVMADGSRIVKSINGKGFNLLNLNFGRAAIFGWALFGRILKHGIHNRRREQIACLADKIQNSCCKKNLRGPWLLDDWADDDDDQSIDLSGDDETVTMPDVYERSEYLYFGVDHPLWRHHYHQ